LYGKRSPLPQKARRDPQHAALWRRLKKIETLPKQDQKALLHYLVAGEEERQQQGERLKNE